ncbi:tetratricopeptide repeat (TPR)-like superfamily protein [Actinidia rufa]|uniref:Tetratricopeptide repeat (TPR)-like superfamily protein n=1 Tax=Actinidia rufa TaxID=165716 RepID=A0A7J0GK19_9ERIC|nr:tetratricopeptide repeat (TPR)-like superfamily protein [Actinidia rufa]
MINNLRPRFQFTVNNVKPCTQLSSLPNDFKTEQSSNDYISSLCRKTLFKQALEAFDLLQKFTNFHVKPSTYAHLISACSSLRYVEQGRKIHNHILTHSCKPDLILQNHLLNMYGKCGALKDARKVFDEMPQRNVVSWTSVIAGYSHHGQEVDALRLYFQMRQCGLMPDQFTFGSIIKACSSLNAIELGRQLHGLVIKSEFGSNLIAQNALIAMYTKFGQIVDAMDVFSGIKTRDLISWSSMIAGFSQLGYELEALGHFKEMLCQGDYQPNEFVFGSAFSACGSLLQPEYGRQIHGMSIKFGMGRDPFAVCSLSDMYAKCDLLNSAKTAFYQIESPDLVSWNAIIAGFAYGGDIDEAMLLFSQMRHLGLSPDDITVRSLLSACTSPATLNQGMQIHSYINKVGFDLDIAVCNTLLSMYAKCSELCGTFKMFNEMRSNADLVSWNIILTACMQHNQVWEVLSLVNLLLQSQNKPDHITLANLMGACGEIASLEMGDEVHCYATKSGLRLDISVTNGLIDMYMKCGSLGSSAKLFDSIGSPDVVSWSSLIVGYAQFGYGEEALELFGRMISSVKVRKDLHGGPVSAFSFEVSLRGWLAGYEKKITTDVRTFWKTFKLVCEMSRWAESDKAWNPLLCCCSAPLHCSSVIMLLPVAASQVIFSSTL